MRATATPTRPQFINWVMCCGSSSSRQLEISNLMLSVRRLVGRETLDGDTRAMKLCIERILPPLKEPAEPKQIQHAIEVILREPKWLTAPAPVEDPNIITVEQTNGKGDEQ
jgi:hypothetical protein